MSSLSLIGSWWNLDDCEDCRYQAILSEARTSLDGLGLVFGSMYRGCDDYEHFGFELSAFCDDRVRICALT